MNPRTFLLSCSICWLVLLAQHGEGLFFTGAGSAGVWTIGGSTTYGAANAGVLLGGLVVAKAVGIGALALLLSRRNRRRGSRGRSTYRGRYRGKREAGFSGDEDIDDIDMNDISLIKQEAEMAFRQLEEMDPAHCFRRVVCDLSTGTMKNITADTLSILNLVAQPYTEKSSGFEYTVASSLGQRFKSIELCEATYDCGMSGHQITQLLL